MLTPEQEKFVVDLFTISQKRVLLNEFSEQRRQEEYDLTVQFKVDEINSLRAKIAAKYNSDTAQLNSEIQSLTDNLGK